MCVAIYSIDEPNCINNKVYGNSVSINTIQNKRERERGKHAHANIEMPNFQAKKVLIRFDWWDVTSSRTDFYCCLSFKLKSYICVPVPTHAMKVVHYLLNSGFCVVVTAIYWCYYSGLVTQHSANIKCIVLYLIAIINKSHFVCTIQFTTDLYVCCLSILLLLFLSQFAHSDNRQFADYYVDIAYKW